MAFSIARIITLPLLLTLGSLVVLMLVACGGTGGGADASAPTLDAAAAAGLRVYRRHCATCHSQLPDDVITGPSLHGIADRAATRVEGQDARDYIYTSILQPGVFLVEGYENEMPDDYGEKLTGQDIDNVVAYLYTLR